MKYRDRNEILRIVLESCSESITKTKIMYKAYLSYEQLKSYLSYCMTKELVEVNGNSTYRLTDKGRELLDLQNRIHLIIGELPN